MTETDAEFIARIKALEEKATPGPWELTDVARDSMFGGEPFHATIQTESEDGAASICGAEFNDAAFIAAARTAIPRLIGMVEEREREQTRLRKFLSDGEYETVQSEHGWKRRALAAEQNCESYKYACKRAGICMTCVLKAPEPYGCTDCLNTGFTGGDPIAERIALIARAEAAERERDEANKEKDAVWIEWSKFSTRTAKAESAQREAVAEVARMREALERILNPQAVSAFGYRHIAVHALAYPDWSVGNLNAVQARAALGNPPEIPDSSTADAPVSSLLFRAYLGLTVLKTMLAKLGLPGADVADGIIQEIMAVHPEFPGRSALRGPASHRRNSP